MIFSLQQEVDFGLKLDSVKQITRFLRNNSIFFLHLPLQILSATVIYKIYSNPRRILDHISIRDASDKAWLAQKRI